MSKTKKQKQSFDVQFMFEHGYYWQVIDAETIEQALCQAEGIVAEDGERLSDIRSDTSNYDDVGEIEGIEVRGTRKFLRWTSDDVKLRSAAPELLSALEWICNCARINAPAGTKAYIISDQKMAEARAAIAKAKGGAA